MYFSVVIPYYNDFKGLKRAVNSIIHQTKSEFVKEIIIVDDCSQIEPLNSTNQIKLLEKLSETNIEIIFYQLKNNKGPGNARNLGILKSKYDYVCLLDSDEFWHKSKIDYIIDAINKIKNQNHEFVLLGHRRSIKNEEDYKRDFSLYEEKKSPICLNSIQLLIKNPLPTSSIIINKSEYRIDFDEKSRYSEDYKFILQNTLCLRKKAYLIKEDLVFTDKHYYADSGLGSQLDKMQKGEISNYLLLFRSDIDWGIKFSLPFIIMFSYLKYIRRKILTSFSKMTKNL